MCIFAVAPLVGAWIEIIKILSNKFPQIVAPLVGAWIEIRRPLKLSKTNPVAPLVGAWIEILMEVIEIRQKKMSLLL